MKKVPLFILTISMISCSTLKKKEEQNKASQQIITVNNQNKDTEEEVYTVVEQNPEFPGGQVELDKFIAKNKSAKRFKKGTVYAQFIIEKDGSLTDIKIIRGLSAKENSETIRLIKCMPKWAPGKHRDTAKRVRYVLPVKFT